MKFCTPYSSGCVRYPGVTKLISHEKGSSMDAFFEEKNGGVGLLTDGGSEGVLVGKLVNTL